MIVNNIIYICCVVLDFDQSRYLTSFYSPTTLASLPRMISIILAEIRRVQDQAKPAIVRFKERATCT